MNRYAGYDGVAHMWVVSMYVSEGILLSVTLHVTKKSRCFRPSVLHHSPRSFATCNTCAWCMDRAHMVAAFVLVEAEGTGTVGCE